MSSLQLSKGNSQPTFLHCPEAFGLWSLFFSIFGLNWVMPQNLREAYVSWSHWKVDKTIKKTWLMMPAAIFWSLWKEKNRRCFDGISTPSHSLKLNV